MGVTEPSEIRFNFLGLERLLIFRLLIVSRKVDIKLAGAKISIVIGGGST